MNEPINISSQYGVNNDQHLTVTYPRDGSAGYQSVVDQCLQALADEQRRQVLLILADEDDTEIPINKVVIELQNSEEPNQVRVSLQHLHLPRLDEVGLINWDRERGVFKKGPNFDDVFPIIETIEGLKKRRS